MSRLATIEKQDSSSGSTSGSLSLCNCVSVEEKTNMTPFINLIKTSINKQVLFSDSKFNYWIQDFSHFLCMCNGNLKFLHV